MVVGVNGVGKTTTIGKLAYQLKKSGKRALAELACLIFCYTKIYETNCRSLTLLPLLLLKYLSVVFNYNSN